jgi:hypothetical protein
MQQVAPNLLGPCGSYSAGHNVHWIHAKRALLTLPEATPVTATCDGSNVLVTLDGVTTAYRNHRPNLVADGLLAATGPCLLLKHSLLGVPHRDTYLTFYLALASEPWRPCSGEQALDVEVAELLSDDSVGMRLRGNEAD